MKRILVVIGLKIAEVAGVLGIFTGLSYGWGYLAPILGAAWLVPGAGFWMNGFVGFLFLVAIAGGLLAVILGSIEIARANWEWAKRILK